MTKSERRQADDTLVILLAAGSTITDAVTSTGLSSATIYRRLKDAEFASRLREVRTQLFRQASDRLTNAAADASNKLTKLLGCKNLQVELGAARTILEMTLKMRQAQELEERVAMLEERIKAAGIES